MSSRICCARSEGESATDRFWHTGQRRPSAMSWTRSCRVGGPAEPRAATTTSAATATTTATTSATTGPRPRRDGSDAAGAADLGRSAHARSPVILLMRSSISGYVTTLICFPEMCPSGVMNTVSGTPVTP